jgi:hypothetical protein
LRYLFLVFLVLRLLALGTGQVYGVVVLAIGLASTSGTVLMTAVPYSTSPAIHKLGIPLYFVGVVALQTVIGIKELSLVSVPRALPALSFAMVAIYLAFAALTSLLELEIVDRDTPVICEWLTCLSSVVWVFAHSVLLGRPEAEQSGSDGARST